LAAKAKIPESLAPTIIGWVKVGPEAAGLQRVHWTFQEPTNDLYRTHGIAVSEETMRPLTEGSVTQASGHRHDIHVYRPGYDFRRADAQQQAQAAEEFADLEGKPNAASWFC